MPAPRTTRRRTGQIAIFLLMALVVLLGLVSIQTTIGNFIDPKLVGRELNISALVVFLAMIFFGYVWGVIGMLLSVPLMVTIKVAASKSKRFRPFAVLLEG